MQRNPSFLSSLRFKGNDSDSGLLASAVIGLRAVTLRKVSLHFKCNFLILKVTMKAE
jgi:hypothetical protein